MAHDVWLTLGIINQIKSVLSRHLDMYMLNSEFSEIEKPDCTSHAKPIL